MVLASVNTSSLHYSGIQAVVGGVERALVLQIGPHILWHDRPQIQSPREYRKFLTDASIFLFSFLLATHFLCFTLFDDTPSSVSRSGRPIELLPSGLISLIGNSAPSLAALMHRGVRSKKITTRRAKTSPSVAATALAQAFKVNS